MHLKLSLPLIAVGVVFGAGAAPVLAEQPTSHTFHAKGVKIHYLTAGQGETVVLIHGLYSSAEINWSINGVVAELAKDHQVIALDMPGHGRSDKPETDDAYGVQIVEDVILLLDRLQVKKAHIVGYSLGGMVALKLLATHEDRAISGTLGGMGWFREGSGLQHFWERIPARQGAPVPSAFLRNVGKLAVSEQELRRIRAPVEVLVGDRDPVRGLYVRPLEQVRKDWPVVEIADAGHMNCIMKRQFRDQLAGWVRKNSK